MKLQQLVATNFMPYRETITVDFPTDDYRNVMIVFGDNMRGKTSLLNAIRWCFYGKAMGRHSRVIPLQDIVNSDGAKVDDWQVEVFLKFEADGNQYELRRTAYRRPHVATPTRPEDFIVAPHLSRNGAVVAGDQIESIIDQIAPEPVSRFFLFDGELLGEYEELLIQGSEQGRQIKEAIEQVLGVPALTHGRVEIGSLLRSATKKQGQEMAHIAGLERQAENMKTLSARLDSQEVDLSSLRGKLTTVRSERTQLDDDLEQAAAVLALKAKLDGAREASASHEANRKKKRADRQQLLAIAWKDMLDARLEAKRTVLRDRQSKAADTMKKTNRIQSDIASVEKALKNRECPTCHQPFPESERAALGAKLGRLEAELATLGDSSVDIQEIFSELTVLDGIRGSNVKVRLRDVDQDIRRSDVEWQRSQNEIERISEQIEGQDTAELARKRVRHQELLKEEGRLAKDIADTEKDISKTNDELAVARRALDSLGAARSRRSSIKANILQNLETCFSVSVDRLRDRLRTRVAELANESFKAMTTQKSYRGLEINSNYGLSIVDSTGRTVSVRSAGAEQVVALSLIDGLNRTGRAIGPVVMDTPFGRLDPHHRDNILRYLPTVTSQFVLLVHGGEIRPETDLASISSRIGATYSIREISETQSTIERTAL